MLRSHLGAGAGALPHLINHPKAESDFFPSGATVVVLLANQIVDGVACDVFQVSFGSDPSSRRDELAFGKEDHLLAAPGLGSGLNNPQMRAESAWRRNLANGLYELERERGRTKVDTLKSWCQQQTFSIPMYRDCSAVEPPRAEPSPIHRPCIDAATEDPGQRLGAKAVTSPRHAS